MATPNNGVDAQAVKRAEQLLDTSIAAMTRRERRQQKRLAVVVADPAARELTFALTDEVLRMTDARLAARRLRAIVAAVGVPRSLGMIDRVSLRAGAALSSAVPSLIMPLVRSRIIREANGVVLGADDPAFANHLAGRRRDGFRVNVNVLGEAILSDGEADIRFHMVRERILRPDVDYVSLKISAICANLDVLAFDHSVARIVDRLRELFTAAESATPRTFVNLDMEEYSDLPLTIAALTTVLDEPELRHVDAGIVLQAYLPDSHAAAAELCEWALRRRQSGGGTLKIRVVKGANLAMERVEAEQHGWVQAPYTTKAAVDASFKRLILALLDDRFGGAVRVGVASHNLFDIAWALRLPQRDRIDMEMLEGMAPAQARVVQRSAEVLLYAPVVRDDDLSASIAYLTRRLDENTSPDNFLRALFTLRPGSAEWIEQAAKFEQSLVDLPTVSTHANRDQDRSVPSVVSADSPFENAPDTDWAQVANRRWIADHLANGAESSPAEFLMVDSIDGIDAVVDTAVRASASWATTSMAERRALFVEIANVMEQHRGSTLATMAHEACKTVREGDAEVSEAVDFARYYGSCIPAIERRTSQGATFTPMGVVVVASPWNFPYAIPAGGVLAALAAGNTVVLKPAPEVRTTAFALAEQLWAAGVPRDVLQFVACPDNEVGRRLVTHPAVATVVLTGAFETAQLFLEWRPDMRLLAETSGKNAMVITASADEDAAIRDLVRSAFGHAGQKCSAASLAIIDALLYDDARFMRRLAAAVSSVRVGTADDLATMMGPLIAAPSTNLQRALTTLEPGESWLVEPQCVDAERHLWSPGVRVGVVDGSWFHRTECFGPMLGIMRSRDLDHAIALQNSGDYGLTGGIQSLDDAEVESWLDRVQVGNAYVNRHITGAVVRRQPFGGWKRSSVGCGPKAGGPGYVEAFGTWSGGSDDAAAFRRCWNEHFAVDHDPSALNTERNILRYRSLRKVGLFVGADAERDGVAIARLAAQVAAVQIRDVRNSSDVDDSLDRIRAIGTMPADLREACRLAGVEVDSTPAVALAEVELRRWVREQAISWTRHRYGRVLVDPVRDASGVASR